MKFSIHWLLAALLAFEPALAIQGSSNMQAEFKKFIEISEVTKREVSFQEMYDKFGAFLPFEEQQKLKPFLKAFGNVKMPKMDLSKIKGFHGDEVYKLSALANGQAGSIEFLGEKNTVFKINGTDVAPVDSANIVNVLAKSGLPPQYISQAFGAVPKKKSVFLSAEEISMMSKEDQVKYIRSFQNFLVTLEATQESLVKGKKTTNNTLLQKLEYYSKLFIQEYAFALDLGSSCVAAGHITQVNKDKNGRLMCGTVPNGVGATEDLRKKADGNYCKESNPRQLSCNGALYGPNNHCVTAGSSSTKDCNDLVAKSGADIPDLTKEGKKAFDDLKAKAETQAAAVDVVCQLIDKAKAQGRPAGLVIDQKGTCREFRARYAVIQSWTCDENANSNFKKKYPKLCEKKEEAPTQGGVARTDRNPQAQQGNAAQAGSPNPAQVVGANAGLKKCSELPQYSFDRTCDKGNYKPVDPPVQCIDGNESKVLAGTFECVCPAGMTVTKNKCTGNSNTPAVPTADEEGVWDKTKSWFSKNSKWLVPLAFGFAGLLLFHWMAKQSAKSYFEILNPKTPENPVAPTNPTAPIPRTGVK